MGPGRSTLAAPWWHVSTIASQQGVAVPRGCGLASKHIPPLLRAMSSQPAQVLYHHNRWIGSTMCRHMQVTGERGIVIEKPVVPMRLTCLWLFSAWLGTIGKKNLCEREQKRELGLKRSNLMTDCKTDSGDRGRWWLKYEAGELDVFLA